jgi:HD-GYP domain-containing protein (c-di-GMP phosphodiesterase class II)
VNWRDRRPGTASWIAAMAIGAGAIVTTSIGPVAEATWVSPVALFWIVTIAAGLCALAALCVLAIAHRDDRAEVGFLGSALYAVSALPLVHGLTAPGVLYGDNSAVVASVYVSLPLACLVAMPLLLDGTPVARAVGRRWRSWASAGVLASTGIAAGLLVWPDAVTVPGRTHPLTLTVTVGSLGAMVALSYRQLRLYWVGRRLATLLSAHAFMFLGLTSLVWIGDRPFSIGWWLVHAIDIVAVFAGCFALATGHRLRANVAEVLAPLLRRDPLVAFEYGLSDVVHRFVAALDAKDEITRDHVVRVTELALRVGERMKLPAADLRTLALGALLHDVGKLVVPDAILQKPNRLTDEEFAVIRRHTVDGCALLLAEPSIAGAAPIVRSHHERMDGRGYPDGLVGAQIPLGARVVAVCDAYDAMANTRQYRVGMGDERAIAVLREHAGSQWDAAVVEHVVSAVVAGVSQGAPALAAVGRSPAEAAGSHGDVCECLDALPPAVRDQIAVVASGG